MRTRKDEVKAFAIIALALVMVLYTGSNTINTIYELLGRGSVLVTLCGAAAFVLTSHD